MSPAQEPKPAKPSPSPAKRRWALGRWLIVVAVVLLVLLVLPGLLGKRSAPRVPYSTFVQLLDSGRVSRVQVGDADIRITLRAPDKDGRSDYLTSRVDPVLVSDLRSRGVEFSGEPKSGFLGVLLSWVLPMLLFFGVWALLSRGALRQQATGLLAVGRSGAKTYVERDTKVTFEDVAGVDEAKAELREIVSFLREPKSFGRLGARVPKGVLLVGPPGTGKTLLARAVAGEAAVPFFSINGSEFVELFVGVGAARVRDLFAQARKSAPSIIFIDEIDALGRARGAGIIGGANEEKEQTLHQLLAELDGFSPESGVVLLAATNRPEILDPALLRAGRFDRQVLVDRPDRAGRVQILGVHAKKVRIVPELDLDQVAALTPGFTGADLANLVNEAALAATRRGAESITLDDFTMAVERIVAGLEKKSRVLSPREREITAYHEMGHALVALATPGADPVHKVSIIPHGMGALGYTLQRPSEERYIATQVELEGKMTVLLGGRAAELVAFGELSTGAADDLVRATELARDMVMRHGMDETVGHVVYGEQPGAFMGPRAYVAPESRLYSEQTAREIEVAVRALVQRALDSAVAVLTLNRRSLDSGAQLLRERETLTREQLPAVAVAELPRVSAISRGGAIPA
jgi:cell division protease FtsH